MKIIVDKRWADSTPMTWEESAVGTHVPLPLDGSVSDDMVDIMCRELYGSDWDTIGPSFRVANRCHARAAIAALAQALGEVR
jgi:hypothetical protein